MITAIEVDGFKSLSNFELSIKPGLNVLVGPNGSGKTNIISFFEFLGDLQNMDISNAICNSGGAGSVFTKVGRNSYKGEITAVIEGKIQIDKKRYLHYIYSFQIWMTKSADDIVYNFQRVQIKFSDKSEIIEDDYWDFDIETIQRPPKTDEEIESEITPKIEAQINVLDLRKLKLRAPFWSYKGKNLSKTDKIDQIKSYLNRPLRSESSLSSQLQYLFFDLRRLNEDLRGGQIFNVVPSEARIPEDSAKPPGINKNGSGLYATLYAMKKREKRVGHSPMQRYKIPGVPVKLVKIDHLLTYLQLANEAIKRILVFNDQFDNQIKVRVEIKSNGENSTVLPLSSMSDGTIKWMSLITILLSSKTTFSIEEPENYLHPLMQAEIVSVMREKTINDRFILLTTHSETILNNATPEEIIVISFRDGKTTANRPSNAAELREEIQKTGFGLGYYYLSGSIDNE